MKKNILTAVLAGMFTIGLTACNSGAGTNGGINQDVQPQSIQQTKAVSASNTPLIMGYYTNWATYASNYKPENIPSQVNEVIYAFAQVGSCNQGEDNLPTEVNPTKCLEQKNSQGAVLQTGVQDWKLHTTDAWSDFYKYDSNGTNIGGLGNIAKTLALGKPVLLSIGGWTLSAPIATAIKPEHVDVFVKSITDFLATAEVDAAAKGVNQKFAGVDIDWEPNGNQWTRASASPTNVSLTTTDLANYKTFLTKLKTALGSRTLKIAMAASPLVIADVNVKVPGYWKSLSDIGVSLDLMTYDYNAQSFAGSCTTTQFNSPLSTDTVNPCNEAKQMNITASAEALNKSGVPYSGMVIGVPAYGRAYALAYNSQVSDPYMAFNSEKINAVHNVAVPGYNDVWTNREILTGRAYGASSTTENTKWTSTGSYAPAGQSVAIGLVNGVTPSWISFTSFDDAKNVMAFAKEKGIAGVMLWALDQDIQPNVDTSADKTPVTLDWTKMSVLAGLVAGTGNTPTPPAPDANYSLEISNTGLSTGMTVTLIANGSVQAGPFDYENPKSTNTYDANTTYTSVKSIEGASNLTVTYNSWKGTKTCAGTFNFDSYKHIMIDADNDKCVFN